MNTKGKMHFQKYVHLLRCPACQSELLLNDRGLECLGTKRTFPIENGIPHLFLPNDWETGKSDVTAEVRDFYEKTPFPSYDKFDSVATLVLKSHTRRFTRLLDEQVPLGVKILEVGCGTGQLSNFLGIAQRFVFGTDMCLNSLALAEDFRRKNHLSRVSFYQMNLFRPIFGEQTFDLVIANGVLHHTSDPFEGFKSIARLVKKGGYILVGLYNKYGRLMTEFRRVIFHAFGKRFLFLDPYLWKASKNNSKTQAWFEDQYHHPYESKHTMGEVLKWFDKTNFGFVNSIPKNKFMQPFTDKEELFTPTPRVDRLTLEAVQVYTVLTGIREGGLFIMIGQRI